MDKRSWPWKKKSLERTTTETLEQTSGHSTRHPGDYDAPSSSSDQTQAIEEDLKDPKEYEARIKDLNDKLSAAVSNAENKEVLVKQHAKVAEEAVSGWEKAETEATTLRQQLDTAIQQKLALEDRVSHLDGALKECMKQLRYAREQQEENIHDAIVKKTRDWERARSELEEKLADLEQRFLERDAECMVISKTLQERARSIAELTEACSKSEADLNLVRVRLEASEKEKMSFKYELHLSQKELEIRNEEKVLSKRAADSTNKQHLEDIKKIAKLEAECQRLRALVRKKLPGPAALAQMRLEIEGPGREKVDSNKKRSTRGTGSPKTSPVQPVQDDIHEEDHEDKDGGQWLERFSSLEEETKMLREALAKKNNELQSARVMCARTASKLSAVEQQLDALTHNQGLAKASSNPGLDILGSIQSVSNSIEPSLTSASEDGNDGEVSCAESWATALIVELDQFKKGKPNAVVNKKRDLSKSELDDFMEMEQLASLSPTSANPVPELSKTWQQKGALEKRFRSSVSSSDDLHVNQSLKESGSLEILRLYEEVSSKLAAAEDELTSWKKKNDANQANIVDLKENLNKLFEAQEANADISKVIVEIKENMGIPSHSVESLKKQIRRLSQESDDSECRSNILNTKPCSNGSSDPSCKQVVDADSKFQDIGPELSSIVCNVVQLVEELADYQISSRSHRDVKNHDIVVACQKLIEVKNKFLDRKSDLIQLMTELSAALKHLLKERVVDSNGSTPITRKTLSWGSSIHISGEMEFSGVGSPISDTSKSDCSEEAAKIVPADENSLQMVKKECFSLEVSRLEEDLKRIASEKIVLEEELRKALSQRNAREEEIRKVRSEKVALETHMRTEFARFGAMEQELAQVKLDKAELDFTFSEGREKLEVINVQLSDTEQLVNKLQNQLASTESSKVNVEEQLSRMVALKEESDAQLNANRVELTRLQERLEVLAKEILNEQEKYLDLEARCKDLQEQLVEKSNFTCPKCSAAAKVEAERLSKEQEIAAATAKLAECQKTILALGQQLKALTSPERSMQRSLPVDKFSSERYPSSRCHSTTFGDGASEAGSSARFVDNEDHFHDRRGGRNRRELSWDPRDSIASDVLDSELLSLSMQGQGAGRKMYDMFGDKVPAHEDYIEAVAQMPSSPEVEPASPKRSIPKPPRRKKRNPRSFAGVDLSKSMSDAASPSAEKHGNSFARFFSRTKNSS